MIIEFLVEHAKWVFSGVGTTALFTYILVKKSNSRDDDTHNDPDPSTKLTIEEGGVSTDVHNKDYKTILGERHKWIREDVLKFSLREMTEFYCFDTVSELEAYEKGTNELPLEKLSKLESFFFIRPKYIENGELPIFSTYYLSRENVSKYLDDDFTPVIACCPLERDNLFCNIVFYKVENCFYRIVTADRDGSFVSSGGGKSNILHLIYEMLDRNISLHDVCILKAKEDDWKKLMNGSYYDTNVFSRMSSADTECMDIFDEWYDEAKKYHEKFNNA